MSDTAYILFPAAGSSPVYQGWMDRLSSPVSIVKHYDTNWEPPPDAGIVITHNHYRWEELSILRRIVNQGRVPVLILADGILEYRNTFEHPDLADGALFKPLIGHKLACIGRSQARWAEAWGNVGKCEVIGIPRFDSVVKKAPPLAENPAREPDPSAGTCRILIATATTPWFDEQQKAEVLAALGDLRDYFAANSKVDGRRIELEWRMNEELHALLRVGDWKRKRPPIANSLDDIDAVITTPSTVQLEAALAGKAVAVLDYHNAPQFTPMAWTIGSAGHIPAVVGELVDPPPGKRFVQDVLLADALECRTPAGPRMLQLVEGMIEAGRKCRAAGRPVELPPRMIADEQHGFAAVPPSAQLQALFPGNDVFRTDDLERLQLELSQARAALGEYPEKFFEQRSANLRLRNYIQWLRTIIRNRADSMNELSETVQRLRSTRDSG